MGQRLTVWAYILPDMSMRGPRSEGNISPRAAAMLVCSSPFLLRLPSNMSASLSGKQGLALQDRQRCEYTTTAMFTLRKMSQHCIRRMASLQRAWCHDVSVADVSSDSSGTHIRPAAAKMSQGVVLRLSLVLVCLSSA